MNLHYWLSVVSFFFFFFFLFLFQYGGLLWISVAWNVHEKSAGLYLQYSRNLLVCIYNTREVCWFVFTILEKSAGLYLQYSRTLLVCIYTTREFCWLVSTIHEKLVYTTCCLWDAVYNCGFNWNVLHDTRETTDRLRCENSFHGTNPHLTVCLSLCSMEGCYIHFLLTETETRTDYLCESPSWTQ